TILFSLVGNHPDVRKAVSSDFKLPGDEIFLVGETHQELGASELAFMLRDDGHGGVGGAIPEIDATRNLSMYRSLTAAMGEGLVASAHDCSDGGLATALAECCFGADSGASVDVEGLWADCESLDKWGALFGESLGRILVSVRPSDREAFEGSMEGHACHHLGRVTEGDSITITNGGNDILLASMSELRSSWKGSLDGGAGR
ncbi:MAG: phosphoribosylformylglycinamidine synthase, partial [Actinomycetia bacterium]|nr:phosphoribosylformylglycinamidine synthase [Actinomycetes bacterium]